MPLDAAALKRLPGVQRQQPPPLAGRSSDDGVTLFSLRGAQALHLCSVGGYPQMIPQPIPQQAVLGQAMPTAYGQEPYRMVLASDV